MRVAAAGPDGVRGTAADLVASFGEDYAIEGIQRVEAVLAEQGLAIKPAIALDRPQARVRVVIAGHPMTAIATQGGNVVPLDLEREVAKHLRFAVSRPQGVRGKAADLVKSFNQDYTSQGIQRVEALLAQHGLTTKPNLLLERPRATVEVVTALAAPPPATQPASAVMVHQTVIGMGSQKSGAVAVLLAFFFGPLGMLYATVPGALVMIVVTILIAIPTFGLGVVLTLPIGMVWAGMAVSSHNRRVAGASQVVHAVAGATAVPAGWFHDPSGSGRLRYWDGSQWTDHYSDAVPVPG